MKTYEKVEHTADLGIKAYGRDMKELFANSARGMIDILLGESRVMPSSTYTIDVAGEDQQELLVSFLEELLYLLNVKRIAVGEVEVESVTQDELSAKVTGEPLDEARHSVAHDIKGVTFHQLEFLKDGDLLTVQVIFDV